MSHGKFPWRDKFNNITTQQERVCDSISQLCAIVVSLLFHFRFMLLWKSGEKQENIYKERNKKRLHVGNSENLLDLHEDEINELLRL
ncbi:CLUMA_CG010293, isoform A [Clunio marinus]|uniref:CLUMA_CG010293, isoform A n=1 Tax=Clunio marinus TaxID=568069 RepID=A0A1J1I8J6_9DIPT|nr:CLUMA_CG010293, isoform A [Clunio marinus]